MADINLGFRKWVRAYLQYKGGNPIATPEHPTAIQVNPGIGVEEIMTLQRTGEKIPALVFAEELKAQIDLTFPTSTPDLDALIVGRKPAATTNRVGFVLLEAVANSTTVAAKASTKYGYEIAANPAGAKAWYIDPVTKLQVMLVISTDGSPSANEIEIGANGLLTLGATLAATGYNIYVWCPATFPDAVITTANKVGIITAQLVGIHYDDTVKLLTAKNCSCLFGGDLGGAERKISLRIMPDASDGTGLGYSLDTLESIID